MAKKPETVFRERFRKKLDKIPHAWFESIQQVGIHGSPDLLGCVGPLFVGIEIKTDEGESSALQIYKRERIARCGSIAMVVTPSNMEASLHFLTNLSKKIQKEKV